MRRNASYAISNSIVCDSFWDNYVGKTLITIVVVGIGIMITICHQNIMTVSNTDIIVQIARLEIIRPEACGGEEGEDEESPSKSALKGGG